MSVICRNDKNKLSVMKSKVESGGQQAPGAIFLLSNACARFALVLLAFLIALNYHSRHDNTFASETLRWIAD